MIGNPLCTEKLREIVIRLFFENNQLGNAEKNFFSEYYIRRTNNKALQRLMLFAFHEDTNKGSNWNSNKPTTL